MAETEDLEVHLATCSSCAGELAEYRGLLSSLGSLRHHSESTPSGFTAGILALVASEQGLADRALRVIHDPRAHVAAASVGGVVLGALAIGLIWWRRARRDVRVA
jgi:hypothetical protein